MNGREIAALIRKNELELAGRCVENQYLRNPELLNKFGERGKEKSLEDAVYNINSLADAIELDSPEMFASYVSWLSVLLDRIDFSMDDLAGHFKYLEETLLELLPGEAHEVVSWYVNEGLKKVKPMTDCENSFITLDNPYYNLASEYLSLLLKGKKSDASSLIVRQAEKGVPVKDIYLKVFQPVQHEIGRLWQTNRITVGEEHYATAVTQLTISLLYPFIFSSVKNGLKMISTTVSSELHELGIRMVTDLFEAEGWDTWFLGANTPAGSLIKMISDNRPDIVAISVTLPGHIKRMEKLVHEIRDRETHRSRIIVGGQAFAHVPAGWIEKNADGYSENAEKAISMVNNLIGIG